MKVFPVAKKLACLLVACRPPHKFEIWPERSGHDFEPTQVQNCFEARPYSNLTSSAKNKFTTEPISNFCSRLMCSYIRFVFVLYIPE